MLIQKCVLVAVGAFFLVFSTVLTGGISWRTSVQSILIVMGGSFLAVLLAYPLRMLGDLLDSLGRLFRRREIDIGETVDHVVSLARTGRLKGTQALEREARELHNPLLKLGVELVVDRFERYEIRDILEKESEFIRSRLESQQGVLNTLVKLAPAFGFVGTVLGLINVLSSVSSPEEMSRAMSLALLTTFYGLLISNILFLPLSKKFSEYIKEQQHIVAVIVEGVLGIADQENSRGIQNRLNYYLPQRGNSNGKPQGAARGEIRVKRRFEAGGDNARA